MGGEFIVRIGLIKAVLQIVVGIGKDVILGGIGPNLVVADGGGVEEKSTVRPGDGVWPAVVILILVEGLLVVALLRFRRRSPDELPPKQVHGNTRLEIAWTVAPAALLLVLTVPTIASVFDLGRAPKADAFPVTAVGQRWSWKFEYPGVQDSEGNPLFTFGELHLPANQEIAVSLEAVDVIHSFWVPKLAGKLDIVPGRTNRMWLNATVPGVYAGQCAEFCGLEHYKMRFCVVAHKDLADFQEWAASTKSGTGELQPTSCEGLSDG